MDPLLTGIDDPIPIPPELHQALLAPFISAVTFTFSELAAADVGVQQTFRVVQAKTLANLSAMMPLQGPGLTLVLSMPAETAQRVAARVLADYADAADDSLRNDCMAELTNVIAGQAKTLLHDSPFHFTFSTPQVLTGRGCAVPGCEDQESLVIIFSSEFGPFAVQILRTPRYV